MISNIRNVADTVPVCAALLQRACLALIVATALAAVGCAPDPVAPPTTTEVAGSFSATNIRVHRAGTWQDARALGMSVEVTLDADGSAAGQIVIPESLRDEFGEAGTLSFSSTWALDRWHIVFRDTDAPIFRDLRFQVFSRSLIGEGGTRNTAISITLIPLR